MLEELQVHITVAAEAVLVPLVLMVHVVPEVQAEMVLLHQ